MQEMESGRASERSQPSRAPKETGCCRRSHLPNRREASTTSFTQASPGSYRLGLTMIEAAEGRLATTLSSQSETIKLKKCDSSALVVACMAERKVQRGSAEGSAEDRLHAGTV